MPLKSLLHRFMTALLICVFLIQPFSAFGEEAADPTPPKGEITHIAIAKTNIKLRQNPSDKSKGNGQIEKGDTVYILNLEDEWCKVRTSRNDGYIKTKYLSNIQVNPDPAGGMGSFASPHDNGTDGAVLSAGPVVAAENFTMTRDNFEENFKASTVISTHLYDKPYADSRRLRTIPMYKSVRVGEISGSWCFARYEGNYGYIPVDNLFKWDRINPYAGVIPGQDLWPNLAFVNHSTTLYGTADNKALKVINPGAAIAVGNKDAQGRYVLPYWRTTAYINENDIAYIMPVVDWQEAKSGDLISVMTTYFAVGISTLQYQGRNWNIHLAASTITGTVLQPGESYNQNKTIGPYAKSTGYHKAPIMNPHAIWGYGGGTCQVNSTFYIANIVLPILITHRKVHADVGIYYCRQGFDAAVGGDDINLMLENTLPYAIRYQFFISDGVLTCCIFKE